MKMLHTLCLAGTLLLASCGGGSDDVANEANIQVSPSEISVSPEATSQTLDVKVDRDWIAYTNETAWIECSRENGHGLSDRVQVKIAQNTGSAERTGSVVIKSGTTRRSIPITQAAKPVVADPEIQVPDGYKLVWNDEFNEGDKPSAEWTYETGAGGWGNNELQNYVSGSKDGEQLAQVSGGTLKIIAKKIGQTVYSIRMNTGRSWKYGYFEARLRVPNGKGTWPAFWMMPKNFTAWPDDGEIDIMEAVGYRPNYTNSSIHTAAYNHVAGTQKTVEYAVANNETEFHVYACEWTESKVAFLVDGKVIMTFNNDGKGDKRTWPFNAPFYIKLNLAWGGNWGGAQGLDETCLPATYEIDYVRVFQQK